jgi:outer membrane receptor protein involved in Fe transport
MKPLQSARFRIRRLTLCFLAAGFLAATAPPCAAAEEKAAQSDALPGLFALSPDELANVKVVTASRKTEPMDLAPNVMYVITAKEIKRRGYTTLQDVLESVPGFAVFHRDLQYVAQVRGIAPNDNEKIAFMINGHSINQVWEPEVLGGALPLDILERIEIIVGPGSVLYGADALTGIVNMITKTQAHDEAVVFAGGDETYGATGMAGREFGERRNFFLSASYRERDGFDAWLPDASNPRNRNLAGTDWTGKLYPSVTLLGHGQVDNWELQFFSLNSEIPDLHLQGNDAADDGRRTDYVISGLARNRAQWTDLFSTSFEVFGDYKRVLRANVDVGEGSGLFPNWDTTQTSYGLEEAVQLRTDRQYFQAGLQYQIKQHRHNYDFQWNPDNPAAFSEIRSIVEKTDTHAYGLYLSEEYDLTDRLRLVGAVRFDRDDILDSEDIYTSPRAALIYHPSTSWVWKVMHNRATRMPSPIMGPLNQLWGAGNPFAPDWANSNPPADEPEKLSTTELQAIHYVGKLRLSANVYYQELEDFISWFSPFTNVGDFEGYGGEIDARYRSSDRLSLWLNGSYSDNDFQNKSQATESAVGSQAFQIPANDAGEVVAVPEYIANAGLEWEALHNVFLTPAVRYFTHQPMFRSGEWTYAEDRYYLDAAVTWENAWKKHVDVRLAGRNLLDNRDPVGTQWLADAYRPRGIYVELALYYRF